MSTNLIIFLPAHLSVPSGGPKFREVRWQNSGTTRILVPRQAVPRHSWKPVCQQTSRFSLSVKASTR